jgi:teichuronic acid biosynthesis glycosyltransferase TuaG
VEVDAVSETQQSVVSIVTPAFNAARFIRETMESVQAQTFSHWEMIIVDDFSQDDTCEIVEKKAKEDSRIHLIRLSENGGPNAARNAAMQAANGRYVAFLDADDMWLPQKLERQLAFMQERDIAFSFTQYRKLSETGSACSDVVTIPESIDYRGLLKNTAIGCLTTMVDREKTGPFGVNRGDYGVARWLSVLKLGIAVRDDDYLYWLHLLKRGFIAFGLQEDLARYRIVKSSMSRDKTKAALWMWNVYRNVENLNLPYAGWCFVNYAWRAYRKNRMPFRARC